MEEILQSDITLYIMCILAVIVGVIVLKKVAGCLIRTAILLVLIAIVAAYFYYRYQL